MIDFNNICNQINQGFKDASNNNSEEAYDKLADLFSSSENLLKQSIRNLSKADIIKAIKDLESGSTISQEDLKSIRLWIVGDADYYIEREDDYKDAILELNKIIEQINQLKGLDVNIENSAKLRAILEDGGRVIHNIAFYIDKKDRLRKFETAFPSLDADEKKLLIDILKDELAQGE